MTSTVIKTNDDPDIVTVTTTAAAASSSADSGPSDGTAGSSHRKSHRRQESMYTMTGLYSETGDDENSSTDGANLEDLELECRSPTDILTTNPAPITSPPGFSDSVSKCHSRQPSSSIVDREKSLPRRFENPHDDDDLSQDCGLLTCRPESMQKCARIKIFVMLLSMLVTLQQALSSGYINSVITTIEKRFEIPSSYSGLIASSYEIGNVITVIFVSYLGSRRHIPVWIGIGAVIMGIGSLIFMLPHFTGEINPGISLANQSSDNICRGVSLSEPDMGLGRLSSGLSNSPLVPHNNLRGDNCIQGKSSTFGPVLLFVIAQLLLGCGGSPLFTLGTTYVDDHVRTESSSMYIGCMYSMAAFGPVVGFLLGAYLLSFHMDSFSSSFVSIDPGDRRWVGMWWGGFLVCGILLIIVAIPFFSFPKVLTYEKKKLRRIELQSKPMPSHNSSSLQRGQVPTNTAPSQTNSQQHIAQQQQAQREKADAYAAPPDSGYGKDIKDIPRSMWRLVSNPVYITTCMGACMELMIVSGFIVFLPKYLETQFSVGKSQASVFTGSIAIPGACIGIFMGGCFLKRFALTPRGAVQFVLVSNLVCLSCYTLLFFLGCDNLKMAGTTIPYYNSSTHHTTTEPFKVNLTAACNFGCECRMTDVEPVCGNNGLTYFSPCHAGCTAFSSGSNYTNCACVHANVTNFYAGLGGAQAQASVAREDFAEVTVVPVATAGPCRTPCRTIYPFLILLFFMTFIVASTQMPLLMIVLRSVSEEERSFALGMQFVIFRLFGYIPAPILFGNLIDSTCLLWKSTCGEKGGRCLIYDIETFRYKYVGLCAVIKIVALAIFGIDWWLVNRRKHIDDDSPMLTNELNGSLLSLNKGLDNKLILDNQAFTSDSMQIPGDGITTNLTYENSKKILIASRHLRNDSRTIQLEPRYELMDKPATKSKQHYRSSSCDVKITRTGSRNEHDRKAVGHSRTNSRDLCSQDFRQKLTHSRNNSNDHHNSNIKFILNYLNTPKVIVPINTSKKHSRNHSYDQIYMPHNIKIDHEFQKKFQKNLEQQMVVLPTTRSNGDPSALPEASTSGTLGTRQASRSKDLDFMNIQLTEDAQGNSCLRHRRTNSKDLPHTLQVTSIPANLESDLSGTDCEPTAGFTTITYGDLAGKSRSNTYDDVI